MTWWQPRRAALMLLVWVSVPSGSPVDGQVWRATRGEIRGVVSDVDGARLGAVAVRLSGSRHRAAATSDAGTFAFRALPPGTYSLEVSAEGRVSSWAEDLELAPGQEVRVRFELAEGRPTSVTVTSAPVLEAGPAAPVLRRGAEELERLPLEALGLGSPEGLLEPPGAGLPDAASGLVAGATHASAASAGTSRGSVVALEPRRATAGWTGRARGQHASRTLQGRDRATVVAASADASDRPGVDTDGASQRLAFVAGGPVVGPLHLALIRLETSDLLDTQLEPCAGCGANPRIQSENEREDLRFELALDGARHQARVVVDDATSEGIAGEAGLPSADDGRILNDVDGLFLHADGLTRGWGFSLAGRRRRGSASTGGFFPGRSADSVLLGAGGDPVRGAGNEIVRSPGTSFEWREVREALGWVEAPPWSSGATELVLRGGASRRESDVVEGAELERAVQLFRVGLLQRTESGGLEAEHERDALFLESSVRGATWTTQLGLRWQREELQARSPFLRAAAGSRCSGCDVRFDERLLGRVGIAFDPRGLAQDRLQLHAGRFSGASSTLAGLPQLARRADVVLAPTGGMPGRALREPARVPTSLAPPTWLQFGLGAEHMLLPGLTASAHLTRRHWEDSVGASLLADGSWEWGALGRRSSRGACARASTDARVAARWRGSRGGVEAAALWERDHGLASAACRAAQPVTVWAHQEELARGATRLRVTGDRALTERWSIGGVFEIADFEGARRATVETASPGGWRFDVVPFEGPSRSRIDLDVALHYRRPLGGASAEGRTPHLTASIEITNALDRRAPTVPLRTARLVPEGLPAGGVGDPRLGASLAQQAPRAVRLGVGLRF